MNVDIYQSKNRVLLFLVVPSGKNIAELPPQLEEFAWATHTSGLEVQPGRPLIGFDTDAVLRDIEQQGFALFEAKVTNTVTTVSNIPSL